MAVSVSDPERARIDQLVHRVSVGTATDAEIAELDLYADDHPEVLALAKNKSDPNDAQWLLRSDADRALKAAETGSRAKLERGFAAALAVAGFVLSPWVPAVGPALVLAGGALGLYSFLRTRLRHGDPYQDVEQ